MKRALKSGLLLGGLLAGAVAAGPGKIGFFMSITGRDASFSEVSLRGARLAVDELNVVVGVLARPVELVFEDNRSLAAVPIAQAAGIPLITPAATNPKVTQSGDAIFRVCFIDPFQSDVIAAFTRQWLGLKRAALLIETGAPYSVGLAEYFEKTFKALGGEIVVSQKYSGADTDFRAQLTAIRAAKPDAIFLPGYYVAAGLVARQAKELGLKATLLGGDGFEVPQLLEIGGARWRACIIRRISPRRMPARPRAPWSRPTPNSTAPRPTACRR